MTKCVLIVELEIPQIPNTFIWPICPNWLIIFLGYFWKKLPSHVPCPWSISILRTFYGPLEQVNWSAGKADIA